MRSNTIRIDNHGNGFRDVIAEATKVSVYVEMGQESFRHMQLLIEEMLSLVQMAEGLDVRARVDGHVAQHAVRADAHAVAQRDLPFEHAAHVDEDVAAADERAAQVEARGIGQRNAGFEQAARLLALPAPLELGLLHAAVHAQRFPGGAEALSVPVRPFPAAPPPGGGAGLSPLRPDGQRPPAHRRGQSLL